MLTRAMIALNLLWNRPKAISITLCGTNKSLMTQRQQMVNSQELQVQKTFLSDSPRHLGANSWHKRDSELGMTQISSTFLMAIYKVHKMTKKIL